MKPYDEREFDEYVNEVLEFYEVYLEAEFEVSGIDYTGIMGG